MSKIPDWAMEMAKDMFSNMDSLNMDYRDTVSSIKTARLDDLDTIALALVAAEKRGIERAAKYIVSFSREGAKQRAELHDKRMVHMFAQMETVLPAAIRQLGDEE